MTEELKPEIYYIDNWIDIVKEDCLWKERFDLKEHGEYEKFIDWRRNNKKESLEKSCPKFYKWLLHSTIKYKKIYLRWNNRSPKDWWHYNGSTDLEIQGRPSPIHYVETAEIVLRESERLWEDIYLGEFDGVFWVAPFRDLESEARFFVKDGEVIAVSQYYKIYDRWIVRRIEYYADLLEKYIDKLTERLGNYVIDFGWIIEDRKPIIVEINPYHRSTHPILFRWKEIEDLEKTKKMCVRFYELKVWETVIDRETGDILESGIKKEESIFKDIL